jgi:hypothetical protein
MLSVSIRPSKKRLRIVADREKIELQARSTFSTPENAFTAVADHQ